MLVRADGAGRGRKNEFTGSDKFQRNTRHRLAVADYRGTESGHRRHSAVYRVQTHQPARAQAEQTAGKEERGQDPARRFNAVAGQDNQIYRRMRLYRLPRL